MPWGGKTSNLIELNFHSTTDEQKIASLVESISHSINPSRNPDFDEATSDINPIPHSATDELKLASLVESDFDEAAYDRRLQKPVVFIIIPVYNEEEMLPTSIPAFLSELSSLKRSGKVAETSRLVFVDDGSRDATYALLKKAKESDSTYSITALKLAKNVGHQNALLAGLEFATTCESPACDLSISIDCDLQQDISKLKEIVDLYIEGGDVILGIRLSRDTDGAFKALSSQAFYKTMQLLGTKAEKNHADYRGLSKKALNALALFPEKTLFLRGLIFELGLSVKRFYFYYKTRAAGESKYTLSKMLKLSLDGITSFSSYPLRLISILGLISVLLSLAFCVYIIVAYALGHAIPGWTSTLLPLGFFSSVQLLSLGIISEYIDKIYKEVKNRPRFIVEEVI